MTSAEKEQVIKDTWKEKLAEWPKGATVFNLPPRLPLRVQMTPPDYADLSQMPTSVRFQIERGSKYGEPWGQVVGSWQDASIVVAEGPL